MGTRGIYGVRKNGVDKCTYNHWDSDPMFLGNDYLKFVAKLGSDGLTTWFNNLELVNNESPDGVDYYKELRDYQGNFNKYSEELNQKVKMIDSSDFIQDGMSCEYGYIANLDTNKLEFYVGFQPEPQTENRYSTPDVIKNLEEYYSDKSVDTVYPCHVIAEIPLNDICPENVEQMINFLLFAEAAYEAKSIDKEDIKKVLDRHYTEEFKTEIMTEFDKAWGMYTGMYKKYQPEFDTKQATLLDVIERVKTLDEQHLGALMGGREQWAVVMDLQAAQEAFDFSYSDLMKFDDFNFVHDIVGIQNNIDRSKSLEKMSKGEAWGVEDFNCFRPRVCDAKEILENSKSIEDDRNAIASEITNSEHENDKTRAEVR